MPTVAFDTFEWDEDKARTNWRKHRVTFEEAITALADPRALEAPDLLDSKRSITIGLSMMHRVLFVVHTESLAGGRTRIVSARKATPAQRRRYEEE